MGELSLYLILIAANRKKAAESYYEDTINSRQLESLKINWVVTFGCIKKKNVGF